MKKQFDNFFSSYSQSVDNANEGFFWILNNEIITKIIKTYILSNLTKNKVILDAGGGTGRWICELSKYYKTKFILYDLSDDMLRIAKKNINNAGLNNRVQLIRGNLENIKAIKDNSVDFIISIYNPISFVKNPDKAIRELFRIIKKGGIVLIMGQGFYNALSSKTNNYLASREEIEKIEKNSIVTWGDQIPALNIFSKESLENLLVNNKFKIIKSYGVPVLVQPGPEDFGEEDPNKSEISKKLKDKKYFNKMFQIEMKYNSKETIINRGMNILTVAKK